MRTSRSFPFLKLRGGKSLGNAGWSSRMPLGVVGRADKPLTTTQGWFMTGGRVPPEAPEQMAPPPSASPRLPRYSSAFPGGHSPACPSAKVFCRGPATGREGEKAEGLRLSHDCEHGAAPGEKEPLNHQNKKSTKLLRPIEST